MNVQLRDLSSINPAPFLSPASYWMPELMAPSAWHEHAPFGFWMVNALRPRTVVELGVHHGYSYFVFCQAVQRLHLPARCFAVDSWIGDEHAGFYGDEVYAAVCSHNRRYDGFSRLIRSNFSDACGEFADGSIDLLHIDGYHTHGAVRRDFENWLPKLSQRGVMLFHDTTEYANGFGVHQLWEELRRHYPHFEFRHGHGLGVLGVGDRLPVAMRDLFDTSASSASSQAIRTAYERLGGFIGNLEKLKQREDELEELVRRARHLEAVVDSYETSTSWRVTAPLRRVAGLMQSANTIGKDLRETLQNAASTPVAHKPAFRSDH